MSLKFEPESLIGKIVDNRYELKEIVGRGGYGAVYRAIRTEINKLFALKVLAQQDYLSFRAEGALQAAVKSENVVEVYDAGIDEELDVGYLAMEWVDGCNLNQLCERPLQDIAKSLEIAIGICRGVEAIHGRGIVHGDISPRNVLIVLNGGMPVVPKVTDFGLAWRNDSEQWTRRGTPGYLAPEQIRLKVADRRSDIYSLGGVLFLLFSGEYYLPEEPQNEDELKQAICQQPPLSLQQTQGAANSQIDSLLQRMLSKSPDERPQTVAEVRQLLEGVKFQLQRPLIRKGSLSATRSTADLTDLQPVAIKQIGVSLYLSARANTQARKIIQQHLEQGSKSESDSEWSSLNDLLGYGIFDPDKDYDCYFYNLGRDAQGGEPKVKICLATDTDNPSNLELVEKLGGTLVLECVQKQRKDDLFVINMYRRLGEEGYLNTISLAMRVNFSQQAYDGLSDDTLAEIKKLPEEKIDPEVQRRLAHWRTYLAQWEMVAKEKEYTVNYTGWRQDRKSSAYIWFQLDENTLPEWELIKESKGDWIWWHDNGNIDRAMGKKVKSISVGEIDTVNREGQPQIRVRLNEKFLESQRDPKTRSPQLPQTGTLSYRRTGDLAQIDQQRRALDRLEKHLAPNPRLGRFITDAGQAESASEGSSSVVLQRDNLLIEKLNENENQFRAVEGALNVPDLFLIQGPPGTGKTTVIAELCYQFTMRGQRVLLSSQANLAVDNALSRLAHHPSILALRVGDPEKIEEEGEPFIQGNVVERWFEQTAEDCHRRVALRNERLKRFSNFSPEFLKYYIDKIAEHGQVVPKIEAALAETSAALITSQKQIDSMQTNIDALGKLLKQIEQSADSVKSGSPLEFEYFDDWRPEAFDLIANESYQQFLNCLARSVMACILDRDLQECHDLLGLQPGEMLLLKKIGEGVQTAGFWAHRVTAMLCAGHRMPGLLESQLVSLHTYKTKAQEVGKDIDLYRKLSVALELIAGLVATHRAIKLTRQLGDRLGEMTSSAASLQDAENQLDSCHRDYAALQTQMKQNQEQLERLEKLIEARHDILSLHERIEAEVEKINQLAPDMHEAQRIRQADKDNYELATRRQQIWQRKLADLQEHVTQGQEFISNFNYYLSGIEKFAQGEILDIAEVIPDFLVPVIEAQLTSMQGADITALTAASNLVAEAISRLQQRLPKGITPKSGRDEQLAQAIHALIRRQDTDSNVWIPRDAPAFVGQLKDLLGLHVLNIKQINIGFEELARQNRTLVGFKKFLDDQICQLKSSVIDREAIRAAVMQKLNDQRREADQCQTSIADVSSSLRRVEAKLEESEKWYQGCYRQVTTSLNDIRGMVFKVETIVGVVLYGDLITWISTLDDMRGFERVAAGNQSSKQILDMVVGRLHQHFEARQGEYKAAKDEVTKLQQKNAETERRASVIEKRLSNARNDVQSRARDIALNAESLKIAAGCEGDCEELYIELRRIHDLALANSSARQLIMSIDAIKLPYRQTLSKLQQRATTFVTDFPRYTGEDMPPPEQLEQYRNQAESTIAGIGPRLTTEMRAVQSIAADAPPAGLDSESFASWERYVTRVVEKIDDLADMPQQLDPFNLLTKLTNATKTGRDDIEQQLRNTQHTHQSLQSDAKRRGDELAHLLAEMERFHTTWADTQAAIPPRLLPDAPTVDIHSPSYLQAIMERAQKPDWKQEQVRQRALAPQLDRIAQDWVERLRNRRSDDAAGIEDIYIENANVIGVTCGQVYKLDRNIRDIRPFDVAIIDEVSKATLPELLMPMVRAKKIILVGDHHQLPPLMDERTLSEIADELKISVRQLEHLKKSVFEGLFDSAPEALRRMLTQQYRMRPPIMNAINQFYGYKLTGGHDRSHGLALPQIDSTTSIVWASTPREEKYGEQRRGTSFENESEVRFIKQLLEKMNIAWMPKVATERKKEIGVITFYMAQVRLLERALQANLFPALDLRIGTVDRFQGMERPVVIVSLVRNNARGDIGFAEEYRRINVAFSRAQELLVIVGCQSLFARHVKRGRNSTVHYSRVADVVRREGRSLDVRDF
jgi:serine/threonine protein kinase